ncbi:alpha/beta hydrolase family protein [Catenuloplanes sp. NPDC051500]|uniref:alpha/beta hydrolase family protein n=1 Tax=Catenuloplanes sp. NPDC051500 TaxID=3363959 RepID=UPI0037AB5B49
MTMRRLMTVFAAAALLVTAPAAAVQADPGLDLELLAPSGPLPVGTRDLHLVDRDRADPWVPERRRELMLTLWYPAVNDRGPIDPYATEEESRLILTQIGAPGVPLDALTRVGAHAHTNGTARRGHWPVVVLSPGFSFPRGSLTGLAEDLASRGYLVVGVDHTYEAAAITFPDGRITTCTVCALFENDTVRPEQVTAGRAADVSFVLDTLSKRPDMQADWDRVAMAGHSIGGSSAAETMLRDRRIDAGVNIDGTFFPPVTRPIDRPFLMLGAENHGEPGNDASWDATYPNLTGWKRWLTVAGTTHSSLTDYGILSDQVGVPLQTLDGERCAEIAADYVGQFVGRHLKGQPAPLLRGPDAGHPEVLFWP